MNQYLASKGLPAVAGGDIPVGQWRAQRGLLPGQTPTDSAAPRSTNSGATTGAAGA